MSYSCFSKSFLRKDECFFRMSFLRMQESRNMKKFYVYILCSKRNGTLYTGVTSDIVKRVYEHKHGLVEGFTKKYLEVKSDFFPCNNRVTNFD